MDMATAKRRLCTSSIVSWNGMDYRIIETNDNDQTVELKSVYGYFNEPGVPVREVTE